MNNEWRHNIQLIIDKIDACIRSKNSEALTLSALAQEFGYSEYHFSRKFRELSGIQLRDYLRYRKLALAAKRVRDSGDSLLDIALDNGFSSHEAFTRAFKEAYGITPSEYRQNPVPLALHTVIKPFDCYLTETVTASREMPEDVKAYFVRIPAHKFLHIRNYESKATGISGKSRAASRARTTIPSALFWMASKANWTKLAADTLWRI